MTIQQRNMKKKIGRQHPTFCNTCDFCGAIFEYVKEDLVKPINLMGGGNLFVKCIDCDRSLSHTAQNGTMER